MKDLAGKKFGRWLVIGRADDHVTEKGYHHIMWNCICECGTQRVVRGKSLTGGISKSCGCLQKELLSARVGKHHGFGTRLYNIWNSMRQRCNNKNHASYYNYGGRGITICDEWDDFNVFREWALNAGYKEDAPRGQYTLDRIDVNAGYSPDNCRFVNMKEQTDNRRQTIVVEHEGESHPLSVWADLLGEKYCTIWRRYKEGKSIF